MITQRTIEKLRPHDLSGVAPDWEHRRAELWQQVAVRTVSGSAARASRVRRRTFLRVGIAAAAAALIVGGVAPIVLPQGSPEARAELELLADSARRAEPLVVGPGHYLYVLTDVVQTPLENPEDGPLAQRHELWTAQDGSRVVRTNSGTGALPQVDGPYPLAESPTGWDKTADMPRDPAALERWLRLRVSGSLTKDEAVFVALTDMLRRNNPDPELRAVMIETLPRISQVVVETGRADSLGRAATVISRAEPERQGLVDRYYFSPATGRFLEQQSTIAGQGVYRGTRIEERVVDSRPA
ncbi:MAG: hypothetical protein Q4F67_01090 [Propionibacteriaceae bacterium]|nr:hypothetical protein [Propionibacteriaceae bacterium]